MEKQEQHTPESHRVAFRMHPRVFAALGSDLVTNDNVAVCELVKNSYDALAGRVDVRFIRNDSGGVFIEVEDDGVGMTRSIIEGVWCVVATPYRMSNPIEKKGKRRRRASGQKGFGRLSCARLGNRLDMITKAQGEACWQVNVDWSKMSSAEDLGSCYVELSEHSGKPPFRSSGTLLRIGDLTNEWEQVEIDELEELLGRLVSPFAGVRDFKVWLTRPGKDAEPTRIEPPEFLAHPHYRIAGKATQSGVLCCKYTLHKPPDRREKTEEKKLLAGQGGAIVADGVQAARKIPCGGFEFEIRAWDVAREDIEQIADQYNFARSAIRREIKAHKGISLYRDGVLVLPKSEANRDWLGLDLRRVSRVGMRLSTSQIIGYVAITADGNPTLVDTSDRERLVDNESADCFRKALFEIIGILEEEKAKDREGAEHKEPPFTDLFADLSPREALDSVSQLVKENAPASEVLPVLEDYGAKVERTVNRIEQRLTYYSRLASIGALAAMLVHEVRNQTSVIGTLVQAVREVVAAGEDLAERVRRPLPLAERALRSLDRLADRFAPLASRVLMTRRRDSVVEDIMTDCVAMRQRDLERQEITVHSPSESRTRVAVDPGELTAIILNLLDNAIYWLTRSKTEGCRIEFKISSLQEAGRVSLEVSDSGPGIEPGYEERIFWPGVTRKPDGLGMGLTVASEIVAQYGGRMRLVQPGGLGGATFTFDIPISRRAK